MVSLLIGTAVLSGCSEKQEANESLPTSAAPTTEALPQIGPADFPVPDEARTKDAGGAEAFARYYIELLQRQQDVPAGEPLRDLGPDCQECLRIALDFDEAAAANRRFEGGELSITGAFGTAVSEDRANLSFLARVEAGAVLEASGEAVQGTQSAAIERLPSAIALDWSPDDHCWRVSGLSFG
ncbi:hypothetical protein GCU60_19615 [Blastococcus saxobsidens]|uniref:Uncharacterized protein n=1 Tax=Blastococcus saxobsidens TaxID=138336 RepID=A0A6L9W8V4_9ACTN|nr:hypothetical protein [Blastococcus saxobsidens]NEK87951.1 hypothetical protein [Blastococcus saxobsidens]